jgi:GNAT superfamily N-acetyltransferase
MDIRYRPATLADLPTMLALMPLYYADDHLHYDAARAETALRGVIPYPDRGQVLLILSGERVIGYLFLAFGYSLECGGRDAFVDEFFVLAEFRGKGIGTLAMKHAIEVARGNEVRVLRLEVTQGNPGAYRLYTRLGFEDLGRSLLAYLT